jgi:hypothetical protein
MSYKVIQEIDIVVEKAAKKIAELETEIAELMAGPSAKLSATSTDNSSTNVTTNEDK